MTGVLIVPEATGSLTCSEFTCGTAVAVVDLSSVLVCIVDDVSSFDAVALVGCVVVVETVLVFFVVVESSLEGVATELVLVFVESARTITECPTLVPNPKVIAAPAAINNSFLSIVNFLLVILINRPCWDEIKS